MAFEEDTEWVFHRRFSTGLVIAKPCYVKNVIISSSFAGSLTVRLYDGLAASGLQMLHLVTQKDSTRRIPYDIPIRFETGIYVTVGSYVILVCIQYKEDV